MDARTEQPSVADAAYSRLRSDILGGELLPGTVATVERIVIAVGSQHVRPGAAAQHVIGAVGNDRIRGRLTERRTRQPAEEQAEHPSAQSLRDLHLPPDRGERLADPRRVVKEITPAA